MVNLESQLSSGVARGEPGRARPDQSLLLYLLSYYLHDASTIEFVYS